MPQKKEMEDYRKTETNCCNHYFKNKYIIGNGL